MNYSDIAKKTDAELGELVREQREVLRTTRFASTGMANTDVKKIREAKQLIAWALTEESARRHKPTNSSAA